MYNQLVSALVSSNMPRMFFKYRNDDVTFYIDKLYIKYLGYIEKIKNKDLTKRQSRNISKTIDKNNKYVKYIDVMTIHKQDLYDLIYKWLENNALYNRKEFDKKALDMCILRSKQINKIASELDSEFYATEYWKNIRKQALERDGYKCMQCGDTKNLQVHHIKYKHKSNRLKHLITLCKYCHAAKHPKNGIKILNGK